MAERARGGPLGRAGVVLVLFCAANPCSRPAGAAERDFAGDPLWDDGKAEFNLYRVEEPRYGKVRKFEARLIVVKEDLRRDSLVKADGGPTPGKTVPVLKLNHVRLIPTGTYDYHQMLSVFLDRSTLQPVKLAMAHFESCGITFVQAIPKDGRLIHTSHSYWDGEADRVLEIPFGGADRLYDALPLQLRGIDFSDAEPRKLRVLPTQIGGKVRNVSLIPMTLKVTGKETVSVPAGTFSCHRVELVRPEGKDVYFFETTFPHRLIRFDTAEKGHYRLRKSIRLDYWNHHDEGDESLLQ